MSAATRVSSFAFAEPFAGVRPSAPFKSFFAYAGFALAFCAAVRDFRRGAVFCPGRAGFFAVFGFFIFLVFFLAIIDVQNETPLLRGSTRFQAIVHTLYTFLENTVNDSTGILLLF